jgi:hypothetical protein
MFAKGAYMKRFALEKGFYAYLYYYVAVFAWIFTALLLFIICIGVGEKKLTNFSVYHVMLLYVLINIPGMIFMGRTARNTLVLWVITGGFHFLFLIAYMLKFNQILLPSLFMFSTSLISALPLILFSKLDDRWSQLKALPAEKASG